MTIKSFEGDLSILSTELEKFIGEFKPSGWKSSIKDICFVPSINNSKMKDMWICYQKADLDENIKDYPWYIQEAIVKFFDHVKCIKMTNKTSEWIINL